MPLYKTQNDTPNSVSSRENTASASTFFSMPFFSPLRYVLFQNREIIKKLAPERPRDRREKRILWFTDTLNDLNGPSVTLKKLGWLSHRKGIKLYLVSSLMEDEITAELPPNFINLPYVWKFKLPYYNKYTMKVASLIKALRLVKSYRPTDIYISTPGPVGMFALLASAVLGTRSVGIYHTDFYLQSKAVSGSTISPYLIERGVKWLYSRMDEIHVPSVQYMDILESRGYDRKKMKIFRRGIDSRLFSMRDSGKPLLMERYNIRDGATLLFTGRISKDKNLDFLMDVYRRLIVKRPNMNLLMVGDGPDLESIRQKMKDCPRVVFTGMVEQSLLPEIYSGSDLFVFPSVADTFGMSVLEAQSCGLPAVVSDAGGPKEIILDGATGLVARSNDHIDWVRKIESMMNTMENEYERYLIMKEKSRRRILDSYDWNSVLRELMGEEGSEGARRVHIA